MVREFIAKLFLKFNKAVDGNGQHRQRFSIRGGAHDLAFQHAVEPTLVVQPGDRDLADHAGRNGIAFHIQDLVVPVVLLGMQIS